MLSRSGAHAIRAMVALAMARMACAPDRLNMGGILLGLLE